MSVHFNTCLLIDDNYIDNFVTRKILETSNFADNIFVMQSPQEAIEALRTGKIKPNVIFLDIRMPLMTGFEFLQEYDTLTIDNKQDIKIFMLSSSLDPIDMNNSKGNKWIAQFVHKPLTRQVLEDLCS
jgi:CheY-like chemotaxis protein